MHSTSHFAPSRRQGGGGATIRKPKRRSLYAVVLSALIAGCASEEQVLVSAPPLPTVPTPVYDAGGASAGGFSGERAADAGVVLDSGSRSSILLDADLPADDGFRPAGDAGLSAATETCDGIDNDDNGVVDDLDVHGDGVCDCLLIATLGAPGQSAGRTNVFGAWLDARSNAGADDLGGQTLTPELLAKYQVIVAQDLSELGRAYTADELAALEAWVHAGGGLMTLIGYAAPTERTNANAILARFGMSYGADPILIRSEAVSIPVTTWLGPHPVIEGVSRIGVDNGYAVHGEGVTLAREAGHDLLKVQEVGAGHLIVFGDEWITYDSEWSGRPEYQVERLWVNMIQWLTIERLCKLPPVLL